MNFKIWFAKFVKSQELPAIKTLRNALLRSKRIRRGSVVVFVLASITALVSTLMGTEASASEVGRIWLYCCPNGFFGVCIV